MIQDSAPPQGQMPLLNPIELESGDDEDEDEGNPS